MRHIPFNIWNGKVVDPSPIPACIADMTWYGRIKRIRVGWNSKKLNHEDKGRFRSEMLRLKDIFAEHPEWRNQIKKLPATKEDAAAAIWPGFMYFPLPTTNYYWV